MPFISLICFSFKSQTLLINVLETGCHLKELRFQSMHGWCWKNWFISSLHFTLKSYLRDIENCSLLKFLLEPSCLFLALFTMISTKNSITLANIGHGAGAGVGKVITQPITEAMPEPNRKVQLLRASCKLEEISDHLISQALDHSSRGERLVWQCHLLCPTTDCGGGRR